MEKGIVNLEAVEMFQVKLGMNDVDFARAMGISNSLLSRVKSGKRKPARAFIQGLIKAGMKPTKIFAK